MSSRRKITVVGAGNVGATCAQVLAQRDYADVVLVDIKEGLPQGKALDINQMGAVLGYEPYVAGSNGYDETAGSERRRDHGRPAALAGMSRDDLVTTNEKIVGSVTEQVVAASPGRDPDRRLEPARRDVPRGEERLAAGRRSASSAWPASSTRRASRPSSPGRPGSSVKDVTAMVLGGHGDQMVPVVSATTVGGVPLTKLVPDDRIAAMVERTAKGGGELVELLGTSAWYAPGAAAAQMVDSIMLDEHRVLPCTALPRGRVRDRRAVHGRAGEARRAAGSRRSSSSS